MDAWTGVFLLVVLVVWIIGRFLWDWNRYDKRQREDQEDSG